MIATHDKLDIVIFLYLFELIWARKDVLLEPKAHPHLKPRTKKRQRTALCSQMETFHGASKQEEKQPTHLQSNRNGSNFPLFSAGCPTFPRWIGLICFIAAAVFASVTKSIEVKVSCQPWMLSGRAEQTKASLLGSAAGKTVQDDDLSQDRSTERKAPRKSFMFLSCLNFETFARRVKSGSSPLRK